MPKKIVKKTKTSRKPAKAAQAIAAVKRSPARPAKPKPKPEAPPAPETPPEPPPPPPVEEPKLLEALLLRLVSPLKSLPVQTAEAVVYIRPEEIAYISTTKTRRIVIVDRNGQEWQRFDFLNALGKRLSGDPRFFQTHKSCIVNLYAVRSLRRNPETKLYELTFGGPVKGVAPVSAGNLKELRARLEL